MTFSKLAMKRSASALQPPIGCAWHLVSLGVVRDSRMDLVRGRAATGVFGLSRMLCSIFNPNLCFCTRNLVLPLIAPVPLTPTQASATRLHYGVTRKAGKDLGHPSALHIYSRLFWPSPSPFSKNPRTVMTTPVGEHMPFLRHIHHRQIHT